ncbi:twin-arginine translocase TatA/TatE family subunit [Sorangium sp. So ce1335]|uniref:twin-arginine translocase TatA/TatE family subunit n=1 Tax=Sorangium sp. So ce1335 TaxID=3133335 RepID=UPI003F5F829B
MGRIGPLEIALLIGLALLLFGAGRIADVGKGIGEGIRNFKKGLRDDDEDDPSKQLPAKTDTKEEDTHKPV